MKTGGKILLGVLGIMVVAGGGTAIAASNQLDKLKKTEFKLSDLKFVQIRWDIDSVIISFNLKLINKSDIDIVVSKQYYEIFFNGNQIAKVAAKKRHVIKAGKETNIPLLAQFSPRKIFTDIKSNIVDLVLNLNNALDNSKIHFKGILTVSAIGIDFGKVPVDIEMTVKELKS